MMKHTRQMDKLGQSKGSRFISQVAVLVLVLMPFLLTCGGGDGDSPVDAGPDQNVGTGTLVTLDGSGSEGIDRDTITCGWAFVSVPPGSALTSADIADADTATPTFTPDADGQYTLRLVVDYGMYSKRDTVTVTAWTTFEKTYGGVAFFRGQSVQQTSDGGFIIADETDLNGTGNYDVYLVKTDASGNSEWEKRFDSTYVSHGYSIQQTTDGGFIVVGETIYEGVGYKDVYLVKTDSMGNVY